LTEPLEEARLLEHRRQFPALEGKLYANFGVVGAMATSTLEALTAHYRRRQELGPASAETFQQQQADDEAARAAFARLLDVPPKELALQESTCTGCTALLLSVEWRPGDELLLTDAEYPALVELSRLLAKRLGVVPVTVPVLERAHQAQALIAGALTPRTRVLLLSHVLWTSGEVLDLAAIAALLEGRAPRPLLFVDGAQGPGNLLVRPARDGVDAYAFPGHKALCGPDGIGGLWIGPRAQGLLEPLTAGWRGVRTGPRGEAAGLFPGARGFEAATATFGTRPALVQALALADAFAPPEARAARVQALAARAWQALRERGFSMQHAAQPPSSITTFRVPGVPEAAVAQALLRERILLRALPQTQVVRASFSYLNTTAEVDALAAACARLRDRGGWFHSAARLS
jgi:L-cysteine/cystine lyase